MPISDLDNIVNQLRKWFLLYSTEEFISGDLIRQLSESATTSKVPEVYPGAELPPTIKDIADIILHTQKGGYTSPVLIKKLIALSDNFKNAGITKEGLAEKTAQYVFDNIVTPFYETDVFSKDQTGVDTSISEVLGIVGDKSAGGINSNPNSPSKDSPTVSMFFNRTTQIALSNKNGNALTLFFNSIPTTEWSRAIPFINVKFQFQRPAISSDNRAVTPSTIKFLEGSKILTPERSGVGRGLGVVPGASQHSSFDLKLQTAVSTDNDFFFSGDSNPDDVGESGTELFLLPQTLINADAANGSEFRVTPIIDKFRPLASLRKFEVDVSQAAGVISYRTAKLSFTLHDRSRLHEIADFIKAGLYNKTEMLIEWGWEHPDKSGDNIFADFINAMKVKEKYQISNYDLQLKANGEVDIDLSIFTKGGVDMFTSKLGDADTTMEDQEFIRHLQARISELRQRVFRQDQVFTEEIRGQQILNSAGDNNSNIELTPELRRELTKTLSQLGKSTSESAKQLRDELITLYGKDGTDGKARDLIKTIAKEINTKISTIKETDDPFLNSDNLFQVPGSKIKRGEQLVSLAKLFLMFVVQPLARTKKFDDIQVIFYNLNEYAGFGAHKNLGEFPIEIGSFKKNFNKLANLRRTPNLSLREFINFISNRYLEDIANHLYGLRDLYREYEPDKETEQRPIPKRKYRKNPTALNDAIQDRMKEAGIPDGIFKLPKVDVYVECVPGSPSEEGEVSDIFEGLTVLRIHVFDTLATAYEGQQAFLAAQRRDEISSIGNIPSNKENKDEFKSSIQKIVERAKKVGLVEEIVSNEGTQKLAKVVGGPERVKNFIAETMPTILFGVNNTAVLEAGLKTMQDQKLTTINMINAGDKGDLTSNGGATNGLPIRLFPAQMNMRTFGCPLMEFTQSMFCDFQTGTSFDNIYAATKIQHSLEPGKFYSSITWTPLDAYGQYQSAVQKVGDAIALLSEFDKEE